VGFHCAFTGRGETEQTINNVSFIAKKVLDDTGPTEKRKHGVGNTPMQGPASRRIADPDRKSVRLSKPSTLNLTYSLVKEQTKSRQTRVRMFSDKQRANSFEFDLFLSPATRQRPNCDGKLTSGGEMNDSDFSNRSIP